MKKHFLIKLIIITILLSIIFSSCATKASVSASMDSGSLNRSLSETGYLSGETPESRMITYTASLELSVKDTEDTRRKLLEQVEINNGFIVRETENFITARIPSDKMDEYLIFARTLGNIENESRTGTDITDQYRDNILRLDNLKNVRNRYITLLERANTVTEILSIERELERVNLEIERLEGRIQHAQQSVAYSNITVRFRERAKPGPIGWIFYGLYRGVKWLFIWD